MKSKVNNNGLFYSVGNIFHKRFNTDLRKSYFNIRVIDFWNKLPASVVQANTIATFKDRFDKYFKENGF